MINQISIDDNFQHWHPLYQRHSNVHSPIIVVPKQLLPRNLRDWWKLVGNSSTACLGRRSGRNEARLSAAENGNYNIVCLNVSQPKGYVLEVIFSCQFNFKLFAYLFYTFYYGLVKKISLSICSGGIRSKSENMNLQKNMEQFHQF